METKTSEKAFKTMIIDYIKSMPKRYFITAFSGMAIGLFCTLIAGTIIQQIATIFPKDGAVYKFLYAVGFFAKFLMGAGIGAGIAYSLKAPKLVIVGAMVSGFIGSFGTALMNSSLSLLKPVGEPVTSYVCALITTELGILVSGKTKIDILVVPLTCLIVGGLVALLVASPISELMKLIGEGIDAATKALPFFMGIIIAVVMGILLTLPTSSAAIGVAIGLSGIPAGAAVAGCCAHMVGFAVSSFRENKWGGLVAQGLGTSMLQIPNLGKNIRIMIPPIIASAICGPISTCLFKLEATKVGSGMGTSGLVGIIDSISTSLNSGLNAFTVWIGVMVTYIVLPAIISLIVSEFMRKKNLIKFGDMKIDI